MAQAKSKKIRYRVPIDPACPEEKYVRLWINGKLIEIKRNESIELDEQIVKILEERQIAIEELSQDNLHISNDDSVRTVI